MKIVCTSCHAIYDLPPHLEQRALAGRVRCQRCGTVWSPKGGDGPDLSGMDIATALAAIRTGQTPGAPAQPNPSMPSDWIQGSLKDMISHPVGSSSEPQPLIASAPTIPNDRGGLPAALAFWGAPGRRRQILMAAWAASVAVVIGSIATLFMARATMAEAWPPITQLYALLGLGWT